MNHCCKYENRRSRPISSRDWVRNQNWPRRNSLVCQSEAPSESGSNSIIRHDLQRRVVYADGQITGNFGAQFVFPGHTDLRAQIDRGYSGVFGFVALEGVAFLVFAGNVELQGQRPALVQNQIISRTAEPGQIVGEAIIEIAFAADRVLHAGGQECAFVSKENARAEDSVHRAGTKGKSLSNLRLRRRVNQK